MQIGSVMLAVTMPAERCRNVAFHISAWCAIALVAGGFTIAQATTPAHGSVYVGIAFGQHRVYKVEYDYDGADRFTVGAPVLVAYTPGPADYKILPNRYLLVVGQGNIAKVKLPTGPVITASPGNNANLATLDPDGVTAWAGWYETALASVPLDPFGNGTAHAIGGDDQMATIVAFTPTHGAFYTTGGDVADGKSAAST
ncbi:MAG: hypothetical protein WB784_10405 [Rhodanobacteraceae bacterium]